MDPKLLVMFFCVFIKISDGRSSLIAPSTGIRSNFVATQGFGNNYATKDQLIQEKEETDKPGWIRRQLMKFGELMGAVDNKFGGVSTRLARTLDKICGVIKSIIPVVSAVCHVRQFQFCTDMQEAPQEFAEAFEPNDMVFNELD